MSGQTQLLHLALDEIRPNPVALRQVNKESAKFLEIVNSIPIHGILNPINVRFVTEVVVDEEGNPVLGGDGEPITESFYKLVDGLHRYTASVEAGMETIPCQVLQLNDDTDELTAQVIGNLMKVETKKSEYTKQIVRILQKNPTMTEADLAEKLGVSPSFIKDRLSLQKITNPEIQKLIDADEICLSNAYALAKLPEEEHAQFIKQAIEQSPAEFSGLVKARNKELNKAAREGREASDEFPGAVARGRKISDIKDIVEKEDVSEIVPLVDGDSKEEIILATLKWALHLDAESVAAAKAKHEEAVIKRKEAERKREEAKIKRDAEKKKEKAAEAAKAAEEAEAKAAEVI